MSKEDAFKRLPDEKRIEIVTDGLDMKFTRRWFVHRNMTTFSTFLPPQYDGTTPVRMIQIGVFEGMDLVWQLQNTLKHPGSFAVGIDPWAETNKLDTNFMSEVEQRARKNIRPWSGKVKLIKGYSQDVLEKALRMELLEAVPTGYWDLVVIDGDHNQLPVLQDAVLAFRLLKPGGWMLFDDVRNRVDKRRHVAAGLRDFFVDYGSRIKRVWSHRFCECYEKLPEPWEKHEPLEEISSDSTE